LNGRIKSQLESNFGAIHLKAEISNFKAHSSGHFYFTLKDSQSQITAVMFRGQNSRLSFRPKDGLEVLVRGRITVYPPRGNYQILCESMEPLGAGGLKEEFERLKRKLRDEGLFDPAHKKTLPYLPFKIALVTSPTGAAVRDMLNVLKRRHPGAELIVVPAMTQGAGAPESLMRALDLAQKIDGLDVILLARGGGSLEDLFCFNDESLARKIYSLEVPLISGVGHEIDFTIADFVADLRAPTPSAAAEIVCKNIDEIREKLNQSKRRLLYKLKNTLQSKTQNLSHLKKRLVDPRKRLDDKRLKIDDLNQRLGRAIAKDIQSKRLKLKAYTSMGNSLEKDLSNYKNNLKLLKTQLVRSQKNLIAVKKVFAKNEESKLKALSPFSILDRGYSIVYDESNNKIIKDYNSVKSKDKIRVQLSQGLIRAEVTHSLKSKEKTDG
jgi:exodeoxyribonuclease VII large subunit